jgi:uroporphyrinogen decarboxylase
MTMDAAPTPRFRVRRALEGREPDRVPVFDISSEEYTAGSAVNSLRTTPGSAICLLSADLTPRYVVQVLERDGGTTVQTTHYGNVCRVFVDHAGPPEIVDYAVKSRADWVFVARRLDVTPDRADWDLLGPAYQQARAEGLCVAFAAPMGFTACAMYAGAESLKDMVSADPGLVRDMVEVHAGLLRGMAEVLLAGGCDLDVVLLFDDMADRRAPHFPPVRYREVFAHGYRRLTDFFHGRGVKAIVYSSGDIRPLVPDLVASGVDCLGPVEAAAGMDLRVLKLNYGADLAFLGGIDRRALRERAALEREIANKVSAGMVNGRYIAGFDGPLSAGIPVEQYAQAAELLAKYGKY